MRDSSGARNDLFVSYAHVDDQLLPGAQLGWVTTLVSALRTQLATMLGRAERVTLWQDLSLPGNAPIPEELNSELRRSTALLVVLSPGYLASAWCNRERNTFLEYVGARSRRVFVAERMPIDQAEWPPEFRDLKGYKFWVKDRPGKPARTLGLPRPDPGDRPYYDALDDIVYDLTQTLKELKQGPATVPLSVPEQPARPVIFLAEVTDDVDERREQVRRHLEQAGIDVRPTADLPAPANQFRARVEEELKGSTVFVQLLGEFPGRRPADLPQGRPQLQYERAAAAQRPIFQWRDPNLDLSRVTDEAQRAFLRLETVRSESLPEFTDEVAQAASTLFQQIRRPPTAHGPARVVFIDFQETDRRPKDVFGVLDGLQAAYVWQSAAGSAWRTMVKQSDGVLLVYDTNPDWVVSRWLQCQKTRALAKKDPATLAIYNGPPSEKPDLTLGGQQVQVIDGRVGPARDALMAFVGRLGG